jgi:hypothetical protein
MAGNSIGYTRMELHYPAVMKRIENQKVRFQAWQNSGYGNEFQAWIWQQQRYVR